MKAYIRELEQLKKDNPDRAVVLRYGDKSLCGYRPNMLPLDAEKVVLQLEEK